MMAIEEMKQKVEALHKKLKDSLLNFDSQKNRMQAARQPGGKPQQAPASVQCDM